MKTKDIYTLKVKMKAPMRTKTQKTHFMRVFGTSPTIRVLGYLLAGHVFDYSITDIKEGAHVSWTTLQPILEQLEKVELIKNTRSVGKAKMYQINHDNKIACQLINLRIDLGEQETTRLFKENPDWLHEHGETETVSEHELDDMIGPAVPENSKSEKQTTPVPV